ncbi:hypothetical protein WR25_08605 [Diploscapter pachys]|uniref:DUF4440 domain-containing protein n=1 Tax=Diploscapter pachys TaxID=2018661 RepID=A0A2A2L7I6_9BILA|nr:hypothetical protein WR25_08605 [Diploscapter pachys]
MSELQSILKPYYEVFHKAFSVDLDADKVTSLYADDGVLIEKGKKCYYGKAEILNFNIELIKMCGKGTTALSNEKFAGDEECIAASSDFESELPNGGGTMKGTFYQVWKKFGMEYKVIYDIFTMS